MAIKNYLINDKWLDIAKQNIVEVTSTDGVIGSVKVNGQEYGGSGGSSDFSTAEVTVNFSGESVFEPPATAIIILNEELISSAMPAYNVEESYTVNIVLYKGSGKITELYPNIYISSSGACIYDADNGELTVTGNCTITVKPCSLI